MMNRTASIAQFKSELEKINGKCFVASDFEDAAKIISSIIIKNLYKSVVVNNSLPIKESMSLNSSMNIKTVEELSSYGDIKKALAATDVGISYAEYLVAQTGSAILVSNRDEPRLLSLLPEASIIVSRATNLVSDYSVAMQLLKDRNLFVESNCITIISGPSRTADIEKVLVTGVHGPKKLYVIIVNLEKD
ncbi:MAG: LUD domain-containing protein [Bacteroidota bacterium]|nr:LUD domain-containing protein [Bacteroidota bacterium]